jgi:amino-acid N-acetyltransferase
MTAAIKLTTQVATDADRPIVRSLLAAAGLPVADLDSAPRLRIWVVRDDTGHAIAAIGLERHDDVGLLRSLVVAPGRRLDGLGRALVRTLEEHASAMGVTQLVLLTETAETFFRRLGYAVIDRATAPPAVAASEEFRTLCPSAAVCMTKRVSPTR